ncbi:ACP S-malonyltransferase [Lacrimispora algidixylanolytica]|uniref:[acyl-carrier-protein] S-malonyltransferase n=1 Tax=Lacrimispora algidixylanolytica TaxID=94868 RepID=A0A419T1B1_9FIRM|nr:ACP S-malonyltransferase [Lacrimispora algidixylanolytica]RKD31344.1 hypothetical protein BET01_20725 [Lacrimispora algidixylanolytica]
MDKIVFLFPGQGAQYIGMGKSLYDEYALVRETFDEASDLLGLDLRNICFNGSFGELNKYDNTFISVLTIGIAIFRIYMQEVGIPPSFIAGHSLGEYAALTCCGAMDFESALKIVQYRGKLLQKVAEQESGGMTIINNIEYDIVEKICREISKEKQLVGVSCYNTEKQTAISGHRLAVSKVEDILLGINAQITPLIASAPFHSPLLERESEKLKSELLKYSYRDLKWPVISNVNAKPYGGKESIIENLQKQLRSPVRWLDTLDYLQEQGVTMYIEMGTKPILKNMLSINKRESLAFTFGSKKDRDELKTFIEKEHQARKVAIEQKSVIARCLAMAISTKNNNFNEEEYLVGVIQKYEEMSKIQQYIEAKGEIPSVKHMQKVLKILVEIFETKKVPFQEQMSRIKYVLQETQTEDLLSDFLRRELKVNGRQIEQSGF